MLKQNSPTSAEKEHAQRDKTALRISFFSSCPDPWGGSEELWSGAALQLSRRGHSVSVVRVGGQSDHPKIRRLQAECREVVDVVAKENAIVRYFKRVCNIRQGPDARLSWLKRKIKNERPDLIVINQGQNFDGIHLAEVAQSCQIPYVVLSHKAADQAWPNDRIFLPMQQMYSAARKTYFVSEHNLRLTELQLGMKLPHAEIVLNPCAVPCLKPLPWPGDCATIRLACIGRLFALEKGQDILIRVLSQKKWQSRPIEVSFVGSGRNQEGLKGMAEMLGVRNLRFPGFVDDVTNVWRLHHALVLPSRCEGMPLTLFEASCLGRPAIATAVGGNAEIIDDNRTGFVAEAANADSFDEALERAWARREEWESIGLAASRRVNSLMTEDPCATFMEKLIEDVHSR